MIIKSSTKDYQVNIYNNFDKAKSIEVDKNTFVVIDKILYGLYEKELFSRKISYIS